MGSRIAGAVLGPLPWIAGFWIMCLVLFSQAPETWRCPEPYKGPVLCLSILWGMSCVWLATRVPWFRGSLALGTAGATLAAAVAVLAWVAAPSAVQRPFVGGTYGIQGVAVHTWGHGADVGCQLRVFQAHPVGQVPLCHRPVQHLTPGTRIRLRGCDVPLGSRVRLLARMSERPQYENPIEGLSWPCSQEPRGMVLDSGSVDVLDSPWAPRMLDRARHHVRQLLGRTLSPETAALGQAMLLGDRSSLDWDMRQHWSDAGVAHVLAVSGLHVGLVVWMAVALLGTIMAGLLRWWPLVGVALLSRWTWPNLRWAAAGILAVGFMVFTGGSPSVCRAGWMVLIYAGLQWMGRVPAPSAVLATVGLVLSTVRPEWVLDPGFFLSLGATAALIHLPTSPFGLGSEKASVSPLAAGLEALEHVGTVPTFRILVACSPVLWLCFGQLPLGALIANVVAVPWTALVVLPLVLVHVVSFGAVPASSFAVELSCAVLSSWAMQVGHWIPPLALPSPLGWQLALLVPWSVFTAMGGSGLRWWTVTVGTVVVLAGGAHWTPREPIGSTSDLSLLEVTFLDVGQGDAAWVRFPNGQSMVIDAGGHTQPFWDPGRRVVVPFLLGAGVRHLDALVVSHGHPDHYGGVRAILEQLEVDQIWSETSKGIPEGFHTKIVSPGILCHAPRSFGDVRVEVLWPCGEVTLQDANNRSITMRITYGTQRVLFTGDLEAPAEAQLLQRNATLDASLVKVPHHGSRTSSSSGFVEAVGPQWAVVSSGVCSRYGHPHPDVRQRWAKQGADVLSTAQTGAIQWVSDGRRGWIRER